MIKSLNNNDIIVTPFITNREWETDNSNPDLILWMSQSNGQLLTGSIACTYIDYGDNSAQYPITNSYCNLLTQQQDNTDINYIKIQKGIYNPNTLYPNTSFNVYTDPNDLLDRNKINIDGTYTNIVYTANQHLFYNNYNNFTKTFGLESADESKIIKNLTYEMDVLTIPVNNFGETIVPKTVRIKDYNLDDENIIIDDGNCNLIISGSIFSKYCKNNLLSSNVDNIDIKLTSISCNNSINSNYTSMSLILKGADYYYLSSSYITASISGGIPPFDYFWYVGGTYRDLWDIIPNNDTAILRYKKIIKSFDEVYYDNTFAVCQVIDYNNNNIYSNYIYLIKCVPSTNGQPQLPNTSSNTKLTPDLINSIGIFDQDQIIDLIDTESDDLSEIEPNLVYSQISSIDYHPNIKLTTYNISSPRNTKAYVAEITLNNNIDVKLSPSSSGTVGATKQVIRQTTNSFVGTNFGLIGINLNFFTPYANIKNSLQESYYPADRNANIIGLYVSSSNVVSKFANQPCFGEDQSYAILGYAPAINIATDKTASIVTCNRNNPNSSSINEAVSLYNTFAGSAQVITNGKITIPKYFTGSLNEYVYGSEYLNPINGYNNSNSWYDLLISRNIIGINTDGTKLYIAVAENIEGVTYFGNKAFQQSISGNKGMKVSELAKILTENHGVYNAINMDGDASTTLVIRSPISSSLVGTRYISNVNIPDNSYKNTDLTEWRSRSVGCNITFLDKSQVYQSGLGDQTLCADGSTKPYGLWQLRTLVTSSGTVDPTNPDGIYLISEFSLQASPNNCFSISSNPSLWTYGKYVLRDH